MTSTGELEQAILALLDDRAAGATICPSEAARKLAGDDFRELMPAAREAAAALVRAGRIDVTQGGHVVDIARARGPIRLRRRSPGEDGPRGDGDSPGEGGAPGEGGPPGERNRRGD